MAKTYEPIASIAISTPTPSVTFSSIPSTYTDLVLVAEYEGETGTAAALRLRFNGDTGSNYSHTGLVGNGSSASSSRGSSQSSMSIGLFSTGSSVDRQNIVIAHIMSYANANVYKTGLGLGAAASLGVDRLVGLWRDTSAINQITVGLGSFAVYDFDSGTFSLFGIKAAA